MRSTFRIFILFAVLTLIGLSLVPRLPLNFLPPAGRAGLSVTYQWPNASPELVERELTTPLEGTFALIEGVEKIESVSGAGNGRISLQLNEHRSPDYIRFELASRIRQLYPNFPEGVPFPAIHLNRPDDDEQDRPLLVYSLGGKAALHDLYRYASETLSPQLALISGIQRIEVTGGKALEWHIHYRPALLQAYGLTTETIRQAVHQQFQHQNLGITTDGEESLFANLAATASGEVWRPTDWARLPLEVVGKRLLYLGDVADINLQEQEPDDYYRINGQNSIRLLFYPETGVNTLHLANEIRQTLEVKQTDLPNTYRLYLDDDATEYIREELFKIRNRSLLSLGILLLFTLLVYRSWRYLLVITGSLIANLGLAFILYYVTGVQLHLYALAGITVSFGIIIDNAIVMAHHWRRQRNRRVFPALLAATLTSIAALAIVFFLPERWQLNLLDFARVMIINLGVSLLVALLLIPALMEKLQPREKVRKKRLSRQRAAARRWQAFGRGLRWLLRYRPLVLTAVILAFGLPVFLLPNRVDGWDWYNRSLGSDWYVEEVKPIVNRVLGGTLRLFSWYVYEGSSYRQAEETVLYVQGSMPPGATTAQLDAVIRQIESYLGQFEREIEQYVSRVNSGQYGQISIYFKPEAGFSFPYILKNRLTAYATNMGGVSWNIYGVGRGFSNESGQGPPRFRVAMYGYNKDELARQSERFAEILLRHPRIQEVNTEANINWWEKDRYEYELQLDRPALARAALPPAALYPMLQHFNQLPQTALFLDDGRPVRLFSQDETDKWQLEHIAQARDSNRYLLGNLLQLTKEKVPASLHKEDQQYLRVVEFEYTGSGRFGSLYLDECLEAMRLSVPLGYTMERLNYRREGEQQQLNSLLLLVIVLIFFICAVHFESLRRALVIIWLIPISFIGIFLTFYLFDFYFDQGGYTAFIMVSGLSVNSLILILSDYQGFRKQQPYRDALELYIKAYRHKITPILLSVLSTALGLIPFLIAGDGEFFWFALAAGTIGGLVFSLLVISVVTPVFWVRKNASPSTPVKSPPALQSRS
ncbi:MAG: efflux RND transporter permease subunit [Saprospiraceae bacterium]|nr:efflux RND transporter permease subunit [Lewinella sp.]